MAIHYNKTQLTDETWGITANDELVLDEFDEPVTFDTAQDADIVANAMND